MYLAIDTLMQAMTGHDRIFGTSVAAVDLACNRQPRRKQHDCLGLGRDREKLIKRSLQRKGNSKFAQLRATPTFSHHVAHTWFVPQHVMLPLFNAAQVRCMPADN